MSPREPSGQPSPDEAFKRALRHLQNAAASAAAVVEETPDPVQAFGFATDLRAATDALVGQAAELRARQAYRVFQSEDMSLAELANQIGVSKARADQFIRNARAGSQKTGEQDS